MVRIGGLLKSRANRFNIFVSLFLYLSLHYNEITRLKFYYIYLFYKLNYIRGRRHINIIYYILYLEIRIMYKAPIVYNLRFLWKKYIFIYNIHIYLLFYMILFIVNKVINKCHSWRSDPLGGTIISYGKN